MRCTVELESAKGELLFELRKGGRYFYCRLDVATGQATLSVSGQDMEHFRPTALTGFRGPGRHDILFSNCDNELRLWIDGRVVRFDAPTTYDNLRNTSPKPSDYLPVGIATIGAKAQLSHIAILRDIYYMADSLSSGENRPLAGDEATVRNEFERNVEFTLKADQFFVLGDNSAMSKDGREWGPNNYWVPRDLLIGRALCIYWPHSWDRIPYVNVPFPYFPNVSRMGLVR